MAANAADGDPATFYSASTAAADQWWAYDYGVGNSLSVVEVFLKARPDGYSQYFPTSFILQWSDDFAAWTDVQAFKVGGNSPSPGDERVFSVTIASAQGSAGIRRFWRIFSQGAYFSFGFSEIQFRTTKGVPLRFSGGAASASSEAGSSYVAANAADGDPATFYAGTPDVADQWWAYDYGAAAALDVYEVMLVARDDSYFGNIPSTFTLQYSVDRIAWTDRQDFVCAPWTGPAQTQLFDVASTAPAAAPAPSVCIMA